MSDVTQILSQIEDGDGHAAEQLLPLVYDELRKLAADVVKLHFFAGMTLDETADAIGISHATVYRHWAYARALLRLTLRDVNRDGRG